MAFEATIIKDSVFKNGVRVTTAKLSFPRSILAEFNTHRMFSRNAASSRAVPVAKMLRSIDKDPFIPEFTKNQKGMQGVEPLSEDEKLGAYQNWIMVRNAAVSGVEILTRQDGLNIHKQFANRLLEPWMWATVVVTATDWSNMFAQRTHPAAEPSFQKVAKMFKEAYDASVPVERWYDSDPESSLNWHLPFFDYSDEDRHQFEYLNYLTVVDYLEEKLKVSKKALMMTYYPERRFWTSMAKDIAVGRATKVSYENLETGKVDVLNDIRLAVQLSMAHPGHWSPFEHICREAKPEEMVYRMDQLEVEHQGDSTLLFDGLYVKPKEGEIGYCGNFRGAFQYRKEFSTENIMEFN